MIFLFSFAINGEMDKNGNILIKDAITAGINPKLALNLLQEIIIMDAEKKAREKAKAEPKEEPKEAKQTKGKKGK